MNRCLLLLAILLFFTIQGCKEAFEFSPNQVFDHNSEVNLNAKNLEKLYAASGDDTITIAFVGDSQRFYDELDLFIDTVNGIPSIDFVLLAGDISDFGLLTEFELISDRLAKLEKPFIGVVGNHDVLAKGDEVFERMFGPLNFSFVYNDVKFIVHNTNSKEFEPGLVPDMAWIERQLVKTDSAKYAIGVSHVPPFSADFDEGLEAQYASLLQETPHFIVSLHGHIHEHRDGYPYNDGVRYITSHSFDLRSFVVLKIINGQVYKTIVDY
jgi:3',5'-cyclic-AMP phosphodiesterase